MYGGSDCGMPKEWNGERGPWWRCLEPFLECATISLFVSHFFGGNEITLESASWLWWTKATTTKDKTYSICMYSTQFWKCWRFSCYQRDALWTGIVIFLMVNRKHTNLNMYNQLVKKSLFIQCTTWWFPLLITLWVVMILSITQKQQSLQRYVVVLLGLIKNE